MLSLEDRFWAKVDKSGECWIWTGHTNSNGYAQIRDAGTRIGVHRLRRSNGESLPQIASRYGVTKQCVWQAVHRRVWK